MSEIILNNTSIKGISLVTLRPSAKEKKLGYISPIAFEQNYYSELRKEERFVLHY